MLDALIGRLPNRVRLPTKL